MFGPCKITVELRKFSTCHVSLTVVPYALLGSLISLGNFFIFQSPDSKTTERGIRRSVSLFGINLAYSVFQITLIATSFLAIVPLNEDALRRFMSGVISKDNGKCSGVDLDATIAGGAIYYPKHILHKPENPDGAQWLPKPIGFFCALYRF